MGKHLALLSCIAAMATALCGVPKADAAKAQMQTSSDLSEAVQVRFDPQMRLTRVAGHVSSTLCFSFVLPQEWRSTAGGMETRLKSALSDAELKVSLRPTHELRGLPQPDLVSRDAALLQQDYENLLGRPAQSVSLASLSPAATRWSATWVDAYLPGGPVTVEAFIVPLSGDWVLELSFSGMNVKEDYDALVRTLLTGLKAQEGSGCGPQMAF